MHGIVLFLGIRVVIIPPAVSIPSERGATSTKISFSIFSSLTSVNTAAWTAAPYATASSGFIDLFGSFPLKKSWTIDWILGIRVEPPTKTTSSIWLLLIFPSLITFSKGGIHFLKRSMHKSSNFDLVKMILRSSPSIKASTSIVAWVDADKALLALSQETLNLLKALALFFISIPVFFLNSKAQYSTSLLSKSSPPKWVLPFVDLTSNNPSSKVNKETSKVPPPKSNIKTFSSLSWFLSNP